MIRYMAILLAHGKSHIEDAIPSAYAAIMEIGSIYDSILVEGAIFAAGVV